LGQLAFSATFTDGTSGIFVSNRVAIPEPATFALTLTTLIGCYTTRRSIYRAGLKSPYANRTQPSIK
jgi:hypothetical protein